MEGGICIFTPPRWEPPLSHPRGRAQLPSHPVLARVKICLMGFLGSQLRAQEHGGHLLCPLPV